MSDADIVMAALDSGGWELRRNQPSTVYTDAANTAHAWSVMRQSAPMCTEDGTRMWSGPTAIAALRRAAAALDIQLPTGWPAAIGRPSAWVNPAQLAELNQANGMSVWLESGTAHQDGGESTLGLAPLYEAAALRNFITGQLAPVTTDEHATFEAVFPKPADCVRAGDNYAPSRWNAWDVESFARRWEGWRARSKLEPAIPPGYALVPLRLTRQMEDALAEEGWLWEDLLAAAAAVSEEQYEAVAQDKLTKGEVRAVLLEYGFKIEAGQADLPAYIYEAMDALAAMIRAKWPPLPQDATSPVPEEDERVQLYEYLRTGRHYTVKIGQDTIFCGGHSQSEKYGPALDTAIRAAIAARGANHPGAVMSVPSA